MQAACKITNIETIAGLATSIRLELLKGGEGRVSCSMKA